MYALKNVLLEAKLICKGQLLVLFGCGGNRDKKKRPLMGRIAEKYSDIALVTDDNPRDEDADKIITTMVSNLSLNASIDEDNELECFVMPHSPNSLMCERAIIPQL